MITDHEALTFLKTTPFQSARLIRWSIYLQEYISALKLDIVLVEKISDFFSRNPEGNFENEYGPSRLRIAVFASNRVMSDGGNDTRCNVIYKLLVRYDDLPPDIKHQLSSIAEYQREDSKLALVIAQIESGQVVARYQIHKDVLFRAADFRGTWQVILPEGLAPRPIEFTHAKLAHPGYSKTLSYIKMHFSWDGMNAQVTKYILGCDLCQRVKGLNYSMVGEFGMVPAGKPTELVTVDFYGPLPRSIGGVEYIFVILDVASKYVKLYPLKRANTRTVLKKIIENYIPEMRRLSTILSDNGTQFISPVWKDRLAREGIRVIFSSFRYPQSNPTERVMRELGRLFRTLCSEAHTSWAKHIPRIQSFLNVTTHSSTGFTPHELHFGACADDRIVTLISFPRGEEMTHSEKIARAGISMRLQFEKRRKPRKVVSTISLQEGDLVLLRVPFQSNAQDRVT